MNWLESLDHAAFRFINGTLSNPVFDVVMPGFSFNLAFYPLLLVVAVLLICKGGTRGRLFVAMLVLVIAIGDGVVCKNLKDTFDRARPFAVLPEADVNLLLGKGGSGSMPSSHSANWFSALAVAWIFYRRSWRFMLPLAFLVAFSRVYCGVHFPADVLTGAILGVTYAAAIVYGLDWVWRNTGGRWFPLWCSKLPSLLGKEDAQLAGRNVAQDVSPDQHWIRMGYLFIAVIFVFRIVFISSGKIQLSEDEAYQWLWSKHLALSYYSKPLMIAFLQAAGTALFGDTTLGVRFFSPVIAALMSLLLLRFVSREVSARAGFITVLIVSTAPLLVAGSILMTIDPPLVLFWTAAMFAGWRAMNMREAGTSSTGMWALAGLFLGLSFLSKYAAAFQVVCWALFFALWKPARVHLRTPGPYLALLIFALCTLPVWIWNAQNDWITFEHVASNAGRKEPWTPTLRFFGDFVGAQAGLLNPVYFVGILWAMFAFWKRYPRHRLMIFLFCMGAPVFLGYAGFTAYKRVFPNWIAPSVVPLLLLMVVFWHKRLTDGVRWVKPAMFTGLGLGTLLVVFMHDTNLIGKVAGRPLPAKIDPMRRVRAWDTTAIEVGEDWKKLSAEGKPTFIIGAHYGLVGQVAFYLPEARAAANSDTPLAYYITKTHPENQLYFWPEYRYRDHRKGQNAIFIQELDLKNPTPRPAPAVLSEEFQQVEDWGTREIKYRGGRVFRIVQVFACRDLK